MHCQSGDCEAAPCSFKKKMKTNKAIFHFNFKGNTSYVGDQRDTIKTKCSHILLTEINVSSYNYTFHKCKEQGRPSYFIYNILCVHTT